MLVLTRKQNEKIRIGDQITITVLRMKGKTVRLGIQAPSEVNIARGELTFELPAAEADVSDRSDRSVVGARDSQPSPRCSPKPSSSQAQQRTDRWSVATHGERALAGPVGPAATSARPLQTMAKTKIR